MSNRAFNTASGAALVVAMLLILWIVYGFAAMALGVVGLMGLAMVLVGVEVDDKEAWND